MTKKNVLILSASPRKHGNSDILCDELIRGARDAGHVTEKISLYEKDIQFCHACYHCFQKGKCIIPDDMAEILTLMDEADVIVVATPTYFLSMNGVLKTTVDRFLPKWRELGGHDVYFIITGHDSREGLELVEEELTKIFTNLGNQVKGTIWGEGVWKKGEVLETSAMDDAYQCGRHM